MKAKIDSDGNPGVNAVLRKRSVAWKGCVSDALGHIPLHMARRASCDTTYCSVGLSAGK